MAEFIIRMDQKSLIHLDAQRLTTPWQKRAFTKLIGLQYKLTYRKGVENGAADALSRRVPTVGGELAVISSCTPAWLQEATEGYQQDSADRERLASLALGTNTDSCYTLRDGVIRYKNRVWLGNNKHMQAKVLHALHSSALGGHSGFPVTYRQLKGLFAWPQMKSETKMYVQGCHVCQQAKPGRAKYPGLLQPLPVPKSAWKDISMDFIKGLPRSNRYNCILVVVDRFSKYAHFIPLSHPFTATQVATKFLDNVYKLHGMPSTILSDCDKIFTSRFWSELFKAAGTGLDMSTPYHPQTDGQTERVN